MVGTVKKEGEEILRRGVWKCEDTGESYKVVEYICDLETWEKLKKKEKGTENEKKSVGGDIDEDRTDKGKGIRDREESEEGEELLEID